MLVSEHHFYPLSLSPSNSIDMDDGSERGSEAEAPTMHLQPSASSRWRPEAYTSNTRRHPDKRLGALMSTDLPSRTLCACPSATLPSSPHARIAAAPTSPLSPRITGREVFCNKLFLKLKLVLCKTINNPNVPWKSGPLTGCQNAVYSFNFTFE